MTDITTCKVINSVDGKHMILSAKWNNENLEILIIRDVLSPLNGRISFGELMEPAKAFAENEDEYLQEMKRELTGLKPDIKFYLKENTFQWRRRAWKRGSIKCQPVQDIITYSGLITETIMGITNAAQNSLELSRENNTLKRKVTEMEQIVTDAINLKNLMEDEFYKKMNLLINTKKRRIRQLEEKLKISNSCYDDSTDDSENEKDEKKRRTVVENNHNSQLNPNNDTSSNACNGNESLSSQSQNSCNSVFGNITKAIENNCQLGECLDSSNDSTESFVLKLSPPPTDHAVKSTRLNLSSEDPENDPFSE